MQLCWMTEKFLPDSLIADIPINLAGFAPQNFDGQFEGAVPASRALSRSLNVPAVEMLKAIWNRTISSSDPFIWE